MSARPSPIPHTRRWGVMLAFATALISGLAVFLNGYAVARFESPTLYTTAKNGVAASLLLGLLVIVTLRVDERFQQATVGDRRPETTD